MPSDRTTVTELGTALGMLGPPTSTRRCGSRSPVMHSVSPEIVGLLQQLRAGGAYDAEFHAAFENGRAFLVAEDGLRGRLPRIVEWKGTGRAPGRRGGAHRPARGPRLPRQLQVPLQHLVQRLARPRLRRPARGRRGGRGRRGRRGREHRCRSRSGGAGPRWRLVRRGGSRRVPGALRGGAERRSTLHR